jgi:hypothetical protein
MRLFEGSNSRPKSPEKSSRPNAIEINSFGAKRWIVPEMAIEISRTFDPAATAVFAGHSEHVISPALLEADIVRSDLRTTPDRIPVGRFGRIEEVADVAVMLACAARSPGSRSIVRGVPFLHELRVRVHQADHARPRHSGVWADTADIRRVDEGIRCPRRSYATTGITHGWRVIAELHKVPWLPAAAITTTPLRAA